MPTTTASQDEPFSNILKHGTIISSCLKKEILKTMSISSAFSISSLPALANTSSSFLTSSAPSLIWLVGYNATQVFNNDNDSDFDSLHAISLINFGKYQQTNNNSAEEEDDDSDFSFQKQFITERQWRKEKEELDVFLLSGALQVVGLALLTRQTIHTSNSNNNDSNINTIFANINKLNQKYRIIKGNQMLLSIFSHQDELTNLSYQIQLDSNRLNALFSGTVDIYSTDDARDADCDDETDKANDKNLFSKLSSNALLQLFYQATSAVRVKLNIDLSIDSNKHSDKNTIDNAVQQVISPFINDIRSPTTCLFCKESNVLFQQTNSKAKLLDICKDFSASLEASSWMSNTNSSSNKPKKSKSKNKKKNANSSSKQLSSSTAVKYDIKHAVTVKLYFNASNPNDTYYAPTVTFTRSKLELSKQISTTVGVDVRIYLPLSTTARTVIEEIINAIEIQLTHLCKTWLSNYTKYNKPKVYYFNPIHYPHTISVIYPQSSSDAADSHLLQRRQQLHNRFAQPKDRPIFRIANSITFSNGDGNNNHNNNNNGMAMIEPCGRLLNVHSSLSPSVKGGTVYDVEGKYAYYHYMQDGFDDDKWGCAYRSMQTICSWLKYQQYTNKPVPTHHEIQKALVTMGDKDQKFYKSREWIGAFEISLCLDHFYGVTCKILNVSSGPEIQSKARELSIHFKQNGSPVMIGGGVLAYTILGIDWNSDTNDIKFLILDPHYTGTDSLKAIQEKGWCAWKPLSLFRTDAYYNMCLPQRPKML